MPIIERVSPEDALNRAQTELEGKVASIQLTRGSLDIVCTPPHLRDVMTTLRDSPRLKCEYFSFLSAVDWSEFEVEGVERRTDFLELLIRVYSPTTGISAHVHCPVQGPNPVCPSISDIYLGALWHEREMLDMFGIVFEGHPKLVNLYLPEDFEGHPLLKSFKLPVRAYVKEWPGAKDPEEAAAGGR